MWFVIVILILLLAVAALLYTFPMMSMKPVKTGPIPGTNIYAVNNSIITVYLIKTSSGYIMIDAGMSAKKSEASIKDCGIDVNDVKWIFLTHSDSDHAAALTLFPNAKIHVGRDELPLLNGTTKRNIFGGNSLPSGIDVKELIPLSDGQELSFDGTKIKCIKAPGHTIGSMLYQVDDRYLFTGDAFRISNGNIGVHPFTMNPELANKTIEQLKETVDNSPIVLTSHYGVLRHGT